MKRLIATGRERVECDGWLWVLAIVGTLFRLALVAWSAGKGPRYYDELDYDHIGTSLAHGLGFFNGSYLTAYRAPGQPLLIAVVFAVVGHKPVVVQAIEALMLAALPFVCVRIGRALGLSRLAANVGATLAAFHPALAYACTTIYPTVMTAVALTVGVWLCWLAMQRERARLTGPENRSTKGASGLAALGGLALGLAGAATTTFAPVAFLAAVVLAVKRHFRLAVIVVVIGMAPALAWMTRNELTMGSFSLATNGGQNLWLGANDQATPMSGNWIEVPMPDKIPANGEVGIDEIWRKQATDWIKAHPARYAELAVVRAVLVFDSAGKPKTQGVSSGKGALIVEWALLPVVLLGVAGLFIYWRSALTWLTLAALGLVIVSSALTIAKPRFRLPVDPLLCVFTAGAVSRLRGKTVVDPT